MNERRSVQELEAEQARAQAALAESQKMKQEVLANEAVVGTLKERLAKRRVQNHFARDVVIIKNNPRPA